MRGPIRKFSLDLLAPRKKSTEKAVDEMEVQVQVQDQPERRPSWRKVPRLFSHARLRVTPRSSSLDLQHSKQHYQQSPTPSSLTLSVDAMSDFLERENELLGGSFSPPAPGANSSLPGDIDLDAAASAFPDISLDGSGDIPPIHTQSVQPAVTGNGLGFDAFDAAVSTKPPVKVTGDDEIEKFEDQFPDIGAGSPHPVAQSAVPQQPSFGAPPPFAPRPQPSAFTSTPILQRALPDEEEPEVIRQWREKQAEEIKLRDEASAARRQETIAKAERSIDQFYEEYNGKKERNIKENKQTEAEFLASLTDSLSAGTTWSRICDYVELQNSQSKTLARTGQGTTDLNRFKEVLLRLKREGDAAPGAAGY